MPKRTCEVTIRRENGRTYTAIFEANSIYEAALQFRDWCNDALPELQRPHVDVYNDVVEVKPVYKVSMRQAIMQKVNRTPDVRKKPPPR